MLKVFAFVAAVLMTTPAFATPYMKLSEQQLTFDKVVCSSTAERYAIGKLRDMDIKIHSVRAETSAFSEDIYMVLVSSVIHQDVGLLAEGPQFGFSCFRCPNLKLVVSQESKKDACANEQK